MAGHTLRVVRDPVGAASLIFLLVVVGLAVLAPLLAPYDPVRNDLSNALADPSGAHWFGTDELGRDVLSRLIYGARISLSASFLATAVAVAIGLPLGLLAGYAGGRTDRVISRISDGVQSLPSLILILAVVAVFGTGVVPAMTTLGVILAPMIVRIVRAATVNVREELFVDAARILGLGRATIIRRHLVPHVLPPFIIQTSLTLGIALLVEAGLSFIGLGVQPPEASWGSMLSRATTYVSHAPTLVFPPGLIITLTVLALNLLGDVIRDNVGRGIDSHDRKRGNARRPVAAPQDSDQDVEPTNASSLLVVRDLSIGFPDDSDEIVDVVTGVSFDVRRGETVGLVGESGCGKTVTARALLGLVPAPGRVTAGSIELDGEELVSRPERRLRRVRGNRIALIFQDPTTSLDPGFTVGEQIAEGVRTHRRIGRSQARRRAIDLLDQVGIPDAARRARAYPHEFSGGMAQRAMIAAALAGDPDLLVADEPTTALDVTVQAEILELLRSVQASRDMSIVFVTHDLAVVADLCDRAVIMYAGQIVETASVTELFRRPRHPYSAALLSSVLRNEPRAGRLDGIPGTVPRPRDWPPGCRFAPRCPYAVDECHAGPIAVEPTPTGWARCIRSDELADIHARSPL